MRTRLAGVRQVWQGRQAVARGSTHVDLHLLVEAIVEQQVVSHANTMRLHGMALAIVVVANVRVVEVAHPLLAARARHHACEGGCSSI